MELGNISPSKASGIAFQEQPLLVQQHAPHLIIGMPKERGFQENRIALTPQSVKLLVSNGMHVMVEHHAGIASFFTDNDFSEAGAQIVYNTQELYQAHIIVKVGPIPENDLNHMRPGQILISALHLPTLKSDLLAQMLQKRITAIAFEYLKDSSGSLPVVRMMSEIAGNTSMLIAAEYLSNQFQGSGLLLGGLTGLPPSKVVIIGAGTVGEFAARTALGLGADVRVFDNSFFKLRSLQNNIGHRIYTSVIQPEILAKELSGADVAIGAIHSDNGRSPLIVTEAMVKGMKQGAVVIDVSIDQGGCFETSEVTTHAKPTFKKHGVVHYCVPNIPSRVSKTASMALSNILTPILLHANENGGIETLLWLEKGLRAGVYCFNGAVTNKYISQKYKHAYHNLELIAAARM